MERQTPSGARDDATGDDATGDGQAAEAPTEERDEPLLSWSFEPASADCNGWPVLGGEAIRAIPARSGGYSCKVCSNGTAPALGLSRALGAVEPGRWVLSAWVRKRANTAAPPEATARMEATTSDGLVSAVAEPVTVREKWERLEVVLELEEPASRLEVTIGSPEAESGRCLFVDDVTVTKVE